MELLCRNEKRVLETKEGSELLSVVYAMNYTDVLWRLHVVRVLRLISSKN